MKAQVFSNLSIKGPHFKLIIKPFQNITSIPGQFLMLKPVDSALSGVFLPRPFSIHRVSEDNHVEILYKVVGKGTELLSRLDDRDEIEFLGPFGNGFHLDVNNLPEEFLIVAGGIGIAPMIRLTEFMKCTCPEIPVRVFLGGRGTTDLLCVEELKKSANEVIVATQDGSAGVNGYVTDALEDYLRQADPERRFILYSCGPNPMLKKIYDIVRHLNMVTYFSLEANMACGMGLCMGCAVRRRGGGYYLVCKDGPVFNGDMIELSDET